MPERELSNQQPIKKGEESILTPLSDISISVSNEVIIYRHVCNGYCHPESGMGQDTKGHNPTER